MGARSDAEIFNDVTNELNKDPNVPSGAVRVHVHDGWVWLVGTVANASQRVTAQRTAERVPGVRGMVNRLDVGEEPPAGES